MVGIVGSFVSVGVDIVDVTPGLVGIWEVSANNQNLSGEIKYCQPAKQLQSKRTVASIKNQPQASFKTSIPGQIDLCLIKRLHHHHRDPDLRSLTFY